MKRALIIAIKAYPAPYEMPSRWNDRDDLVGVLSGKGFQVSTLTDSQASRSGILSGMQTLVDSLVSGDSGVIAFLGHGSYITGPEPDGRTECICPIDYATKGVITDDQIAAILARKVTGANLDVILDCCYAGTGTRAGAISEGKGLKWKNLQAGGIPGPLPAPKGDKTSVPVSSMKHVLWAACKANQLAWWGTISGVPRSVYITYLAYAMLNYPAYTRAQIDAWVYPRVKAVHVGQECQLEGPQTEFSQLPFT